MHHLRFQILGRGRARRFGSTRAKALTPSPKPNGRSTRITISQVLKISGQQHLAKGTQRLIFAHPGDRRFVLKIPYGTDGAAAMNRHIGREKHLLDRVAARLKTDPNPPIPKYFGVVDTDMGPADVFEAFYGPKGVQLAPTLRHFLRIGQVNGGRLKRLNELIHKLEDWDIPVSDLNAGNFVFCSRNGQYQFVLVDGFGDYRRFPMARWFSRVRRKRIAQGCRDLTRGWDLQWDHVARQFRT